MRLLQASLVVASLVVGLLAFGQTRTVVFDAAADARVLSVQLFALPDGGCDMVVCGEVAQGDTAIQAGCEAFTLGAAVNQHRCQALVGVGTAKWLKRAGFPVDAGTP